MEIHYYDVNGLRKIEGAILPTVCKIPFGPIEPTMYYKHIKENIEIKTQPKESLDENQELINLLFVRMIHQEQLQISLTCTRVNQELVELPFEGVGDLDFSTNKLKLYRPTYECQTYGAYI